MQHRFRQYFEQSTSAPAAAGFVPFPVLASPGLMVAAPAFVAAVYQAAHAMTAAVDDLRPPPPGPPPGRKPAALPAVYGGPCGGGGYKPPPVTAGGPHVLVTDPDEDRRRRAGEPVPVVLHPLTPYVLDEFGLS